MIYRYNFSSWIKLYKISSVRYLLQTHVYIYYCIYLVMCKNNLPFNVIANKIYR